MDIGQRIQALRLKRGLSQETLGELMNVSRQSVSKWELGQALPDVEKIIQLCRLFDVSTDALLLDEKRVDTRPGRNALRFGMYLIVKDFGKSIAFYEKLLDTQALIVGPNRFARFLFDGVCISVMNEAHLPGHDYTGGGDHKFAFNFQVRDLSAEHERVKSLKIGAVTEIIHAHSNYYFFNVYDPDRNVIEITGHYAPG
jgi:transcriptional regulator with XRE-family HTH domain